ncbi:Sfk1 protein [Starmerella bacillaris]|uniref:Sfk1 protein n=1 Tax=Starmerella bacillaris TaxID=1247836 RepID=A0AAV5RNS8_STABA|nr:Sfk1 protein [Starmerella bacillaris]
MKDYMTHFWLVPVFSGIIWWCMLIVMLSLWSNEGFQTYTWMEKSEQKILYLSDIAAEGHGAIFIGCAASQGALFVLSLVTETYLRNVGWLRPNHRTYGQVCSGLAIFFAVVGQLGILFVSIFNTREYHHAHISLLVVFIVFVGISAICSCAEYMALDKDYVHKRHMIWGFWLKVVWFVIELVMVIVFGSTQKNHVNVPAVFEWIICFLYPFYHLILAWDLWPAIGKRKGHYPKYNDGYPVEEMLTRWESQSQAPPDDEYPLNWRTSLAKPTSTEGIKNDVYEYSDALPYDGYRNT